MKITIEFSTDNAAFSESPHQEISKVMSDALVKMNNGEGWGIIRDTNGNTIGHFEVK